jgi:hypothetical protein
MTNKEAYLFITTLMGLNTTPGTKLEHAKTQTLKKASPFIDAYNDKLEDIYIDFCSTDDRGNIIRDTRGQYIFTKDNQRSLAKELKKFMDDKMVFPFEVVSTSDKKGLTDAQTEYLTEIGFVRVLMKTV